MNFTWFMIVFIIERTSDITQIAAVCDNKTFNRYIRPGAEINLEATNVTWITCVGGIMKHNGTVVKNIDPWAALQDFIDFINSFESKSIVLGHNIQSYDIPVFMHQLTKFRLLDDFKIIISGFNDTLRVSKRATKVFYCVITWNFVLIQHTSFTSYINVNLQYSSFGTCS